MQEIVHDLRGIIDNIKRDIKSTRFRAIENVNQELLSLYFRIGKVISENSNYGSNFIETLSKELRSEFPDMRGLSARNLARMKAFYEEYEDFSKLPPVVAKLPPVVAKLPVTLAKLPWAHNYTLMEKVKDREKRVWYAKKCLENGWSKAVLIHQIDSDLYKRQRDNLKLANFDDKMPVDKSELVKNMIKDPYIFELANLKERATEKDIELSMLEKIKTMLLEFGKGFSFVGNQYKISANGADYFIDLLFYHIGLRCYVAVELKNTNFRPEYVGQLNFYVTAINKILKGEHDNDTIGLLLCKEKDRLSVEWALEGVNNPIGVSSYEISKYLPTEEEMNARIELN